MSEFIKLQEGIAMTKAYRGERDDLIRKGIISSQFLPLCETFQKDQVSQLLDKSGCESLRIYLGVKDEEIKMILVAVNEKDEDILPSATTASASKDGDDDDLLEKGVRCPTICPPASSLNS